MTCEAGTAPPADGAVQVLSRLHQLTLTAARCDSREALAFTILNDSIALCRYDRAVLWDLRTSRPHLLGVSGVTDATGRTRLAEDWHSIVEALTTTPQPLLLDPTSLPEHAAAWERLNAATPGLGVVWLPLLHEGRSIAGLWLERWDHVEWRQDELRLLAALTDSYAAIWMHWTRSVWPRRFVTKSRSRWIVVSALGLLLAVALLVPMRMRVVAPCEVIPADPCAVTAPLDGVIEQALAMPGQAVRTGDALLRYDSHAITQEMTVASQQVAVREAQLQRAMAQAFQDEQALAEIALLRHRLEQDRARLELAEYRRSRLVVTAPTDGLVSMDHPEEWRGRPVRTGERILTLVNPERTRLRIRIAEDDNVGFDESLPVSVVLHAAPDRTLDARLTYLAQRLDADETGVPSFVAEAEWSDNADTARIGLRGTATLRGDPVSPAYYVLRKPWATLRRLLGW